jgi:hypothetical protein
MNIPYLTLNPKVPSRAHGARPNLPIMAVQNRQRRTPPGAGSNRSLTTVIAFAASDFPSVFQGFLHRELHIITPASQNAHNIVIFLAPAHSRPVHNRRSGAWPGIVAARVTALRMAFCTI